MAIVELLRKIDNDGKPLSYRIHLKHQLNRIRELFSNTTDGHVKEAKGKLDRSEIFDSLLETIDILKPPIEIHAAQATAKTQEEADFAIVRLMLSWEIDEPENKPFKFRKGLIISSTSLDETISVFSGKFKLEVDKKIEDVLLMIEGKLVPGEPNFLMTLNRDSWGAETIVESAIADALHTVGVRAPN